MENKQKNKGREEQEEFKKIEKIERKKEQEKEQKQYEKDLLIACYHDLKNSFDRVFERTNPKNEMELNVLLAQFYNIETRKEYTKTFGTTVIQQDYIDKIYDKTLNEVYNKWKNNLKYIELQQIKEEAKKQEEINKSKAFNIFMGLVFSGVIIWLLIKFALIVGIVLAVIIFLVILGCAMN